MDPTHGDDRPATAEAAPDVLLRMRLAIADAAFVADGLALGLPLKWAERAPRIGARRALDDSVL